MGVGVSSKVQPILTIMDSMTSEPRSELQAAIDREGQLDDSVCPVPPHALLSQVQNKIDVLRRWLATA